MGNYNSGYYREKKELIENSIKLDIHYLFRKINIHDDMAGTIKLKNNGLSVVGDFKIEQKKQSYIYINEYETAPTPPQTLFIFDYKILNTHQDMIGDGFLRVEINRLKRVCAKCPRCGRWFTMLYIPPNHRDFECLECHNLTYRSVQTAVKSIDSIFDKWFFPIYMESVKAVNEELSKEKLSKENNIN